MTITYPIGESLYINLTNRCTNACEFCIRDTSCGVGEFNLWLSKEPEAAELIAEILSYDLSKYKEIVFCGYGEPILRLTVLLEVVRAVKQHSALPIRINTNGQANLIYQTDVTPQLKGLIDTVSISLNAKNSQEYQAICHSDFGEAAFEGLLDFAHKCKAYVPNVVLSVVDIMPLEDIEACRAIAKSIGVKFRVRQLIE